MDKTIIEEAWGLVNGDRKNDYGTAKTNMSRTAKIWSGILDIDVTPEQVALCMAGVKLARTQQVYKRDNVVDAVGYLLVYDDVKTT